MRKEKNKHTWLRHQANMIASSLHKNVAVFTYRTQTCWSTVAIHSPTQGELQSEVISLEHTAIPEKTCFVLSFTPLDQQYDATDDIPLASVAASLAMTTPWVVKAKVRAPNDTNLLKLFTFMRWK